MPKKRTRRVRRGHPVAILIGLHDDNSVFWRIFSGIVKQECVIKRGRKRKYQDNKQVYHFHEEIVNKLRPIIREGMKSVLIVSPPKEEYSKEFISHVKKHHSWMFKNKVVFNEIVGSAKTLKSVFYLVNQEIFKDAVKETSNQEAMLILEELNDLISKPYKYSEILYTVREIERELDRGWKIDEKKPNYILLTDDYLKNFRQKSRIHRLLQIAKNRGIKTKIVSADSDAGRKITSFGGLICFTN
jgi:stalled ribosome rescue protein Dom34